MRNKVYLKKTELAEKQKELDDRENEVKQLRDRIRTL